MKYADVIVTPLNEHRYEVQEPLSYKDVIVHAGYRTNGADIPRIFWSIIPPNRSDILPAVIIHDYLCDMGLYSKADRYFREVLELLEVDTKSVLILHLGVSIYTKFIRPIIGVFMSKKKSNAILHKQELLEHFANEANCYLYKKKDDGSLVCCMCCDFEIVDADDTIERGSCGDAIVYDLESKQITIEKRGN